MILFIRISDNVLGSEEWSVARLVIIDDRVTDMVIVHQGCYDIRNMVGQSLADLTEWQNYDPSGQHPETYYEVSKDLGKWHFLLSEDEIRALVEK